MTAKRYYAHKHLINKDKVHDKICHRFMDLSETVEHMNMYYQKYTALKKENEQLKHYAKSLLDTGFERRVKLEKELMKYQETIKAAIQNERTDLGKSVLTQLAENLEVEL